MRILLDSRLYRQSTAGIGRYSRELIDNLIAIDKANTYILLLTPADAAECTVEAPNVEKVVTDIAHFTLAEQTKLPALLAAQKPDLVHFLNFNHPVGYRGKYITTVHDLTMNFFPVGRQRNPILRLPYLYVMQHAASAAQAVIVPTETVKRDVITHLNAPAEKIRAIYEGAPVVEGAAKPLTAEQRKKLGITKPYILFVSQWRPHKGLGVLVEAFAQLKKDHDIQLVVSGKPNKQFPEVAAAIENSPHRSDIVTPGFVDDDTLASLYASAQLFVFPSWYEGFGLPPLEAMARGIPVAASNASVMPEILGKGAAYFDPRDPVDMAQTIGQLLTDPKALADLTAKGTKQVKKYSWRKMAEETLALYNEVVKG